MDPNLPENFSVAFKIILVFSLFEFIDLALVGVPSRRPVIWETVFHVPDPNPLPYAEEVVKSIKMSDVLELKNLSNEDLKKRLASQIDVEDWTDECGKCGYPKLLHKDLYREASCTKKQNWQTF